MEGFETQIKSLIESIDELKSMGNRMARKVQKAMKNVKVQISFDDMEASTPSNDATSVNNTQVTPVPASVVTENEKKHSVWIDL